jgi:hypothetical protein
MQVCAWCDRELGIGPASVRGVAATNWGMCSGCLSNRLAALMAESPPAPFRPLHHLDPTRPKGARRLGRGRAA